jgi:hypothetical protein
MSLNRFLALTCAASAIALACGKSTPTGPTGPTLPAVIVNTYVGEMSLAGGVTGTLTLRASTSLASLEPGGIPVLSRLLAWVEPVVAAQGSTATGLLVTSNGEVVTLSGTFSDSTFSVSGGGYSIVAAVTSTSTGTSISGTATLPGGGTAAVTPPGGLPGTSPAPANPAGTYSGTFQISTTARFVSQRADGSVPPFINCTYSVTVDGKLTVWIPGVLTSGLVQAQLDSSWTERIGSTNCPASTGLNTLGPVSPPAGTAYFEGSASSLVFGRVDQGPGANGAGTITRAETFTGAISGSTVVMKVSRSFQVTSTFSNDTGILFKHEEGYPTVSVVTTLTKQ